MIILVFYYKNSHTDKLKIELQIAMVDLNRNDGIGFRILNSYKNNIRCIKYLSENYFFSKYNIYEWKNL